MARGPQTQSAQPTPSTRAGTFILLALAAAVAFLHLLTNSRYGLHRDELQVLSDSLHPDFGFVPYPPFVPLVERLGLHLFGLSLIGLRLFSVLAQSTVVVLAGLIARALGGKRLAQITAALSLALSRFALFEGTQFEYSSFDLLWRVLALYLVVRLVTSADPRWWLAIGVAVGLGLETKYTVAFTLAGILGGLILTPHRRLLASRWFLAGATVAFLIFLPNLLWQANHRFITLDFLRHIHLRDVAMGRAHGFLLQQFTLSTNLAAAPLWIAGLIAFIRTPRLRVFAWFFLIPLALFFLADARAYYLAPDFVIPLAMGAVIAERWLPTLPRPRRIALASAFFLGLALWGALMASIVIPFASAGPLRSFALQHNGELREEIGWPDLIRTVASIRNTLTPAQQQHLGIITGNYGEQGAVELLGPPFHLPPPISFTNSAWRRGYPTPPPDILIVLGFNRAAAVRTFSGCRPAAHNTNAEGIRNDESITYPDIFLCAAPRQPWPQFWQNARTFD
jgi:4-amino-4-deoxy-L-arabinose transferase-like glycosyltransferase